jgi:hypothetical protein
MDTPPASQQVTSLDDLAQGRGYIRLITLPSGPLSVTAATEHHVINANKSFTKEQLLCRGGDGGGGIQFGRGSSMEAKETEEKAKQMGYTGPSADSSDGVSKSRHPETLLLRDMEWHAHSILFC